MHAPATDAVRPAEAKAIARPVPPLRNGDRLTRPEFERRYHAMPSVKKAELIEGEVFMPSPVRVSRHGLPHMVASYWIMSYWHTARALITGDNATVRLDLDNEPQPDVFLAISRAAGGLSGLDEGDYLEGPPELVVEIAASSVSIDLNRKLHVYRRAGVREYVVWRTDDAEVDWLVLRDGRCERREPEHDGLLKSDVFPGLWLDRVALLSHDLPKLAAAVGLGVEAEGEAHAALVRRLAAAG
jgi:Uma2 family endonuclease